MSAQQTPEIPPEAVRSIEAARKSNALGLNLSGLDLTTIPESLSQLANLQMLGLDDNQIAAIPESLSQLTNLRELSLANNQIAAIPDALSQLTNLRELFLANNQIAAIPESLSQLTNLQQLNLDGNPLPEEVFAALKLGVPSFLRYLAALASAQKVFPRTVKLVLLGEPESGKTTLCEALDGNKTPCDPKRKETVGIDVRTITKLHPTDQAPMYLSVWDFAGQHMEHATHQFFLTESAVYLILWKTRKGTESGNRDLWYWLELLHMRVPNPKFLVVATHAEHTPPDLNLSEVQRSYHGYQGCFSVDLCKLEGWDALHQRILELAADSPSIRAEWNPNKLAVRDELRKLRKKQPHITQAAFQKLMKQNGVREDIHRSDLAGQLHALGEILFYQQPEELSGLVILDPEWVTERIALVVRSQEVRKNRGILRKADLDTIWNKSKFHNKAPLTPKEKSYLIHLMDRFDLTYSTGGKSDLGIVVEALPYSTPEDIADLELDPTLRQLECIFKFPSMKRRLPPGIPTWAIARAQRYRTGKAFRDAARFEDPRTKSQALIVSSEIDREVRLSVAADFPPFFFGQMKAILLDTFDRYQGAEPELRLPCPCKNKKEGTGACSQSYRYETVVKRHADGEDHVSCDVSGKNVELNALLIGFTPSTDEGREALLSEMRRRTTAGIGLVWMERFAAVVLPEMERSTTAGIRAQNEAGEKNCPSVFTLKPSRDFKLLKEGEQLDLILYCEQDAGWHPTSHSVYRFPLEPKWLDRIKEKWNQFERITKYVAPLVKVAGKAHPATLVAGEIVGRLPEVQRPALRKLSGELGEREGPGYIDIGTRAVLKQLLDDLDATRPPSEKNGGLHQIAKYEDGRVLWLCPEHYEAYRRR